MDACRTGPARPLRSGPRLPMRGGIPATPTAGRPIPTMAHRTKTLVGLDIEPGIVPPSVAPSTAACRRARRRRAARPGRRPRRRGRRRRGLTEALSALPREQGPGQARPHRRRQPADRRPRHGAAALEDAKDLEAAVRFQAQDELPMPLDHAVIDYQPLGLVETRPGRATASLLVAARRDMIERVLAALRGAGLRPEGVDLSAFAMVRALPRGLRGRARPLPLRRRPDEPRGRPRHRLPSPASPAAASRPWRSSSPSASA